MGVLTLESCGRVESYKKGFDSKGVAERNEWSWELEKGKLTARADGVGVAVNLFGCIFHSDLFR